MGRKWGLLGDLHHGNSVGAYFDLRVPAGTLEKKGRVMEVKRAAVS
jgi:hypothetical protein